MKTASRKLTVALACFALLMGQAPLASARLGSRASGAVARPAPSSSQYQSPGRLGAGQSSGMQRPQVMQSVRTPPPPSSGPAPAGQAQSAALPAPSPIAPSAPAVAPGPGTPGWVKPALAGAAVGALAGYAISNHNAAPGGGNGSGSAGANANYGDPSAGGGALAGAASQGASGMGGFGGMALLLLLAGAAYFFWRKRKASPLAQFAQFAQGGRGAPSDGAGRYDAAPGFASLAPAPSSASLEAPAGLVPLQAFRSLQDFNSFGNKDALRQVTTPDMFAELEPGVGSAPLHILSLSADVQDIAQEAEQTVVSVRYKGTVSEGTNLPEHMDEVWHFVKARNAGDNWLLAGIEQV